MPESTSTSHSLEFVVYLTESVSEVVGKEWQGADVRKDQEETWGLGSSLI